MPSYYSDNVTQLWSQFQEASFSIYKILFPEILDEKHIQDEGRSSFYNCQFILRAFFIFSNPDLFIFFSHPRYGRRVRESVWEKKKKIQGPHHHRHHHHLRRVRRAERCAFTKPAEGAGPLPFHPLRLSHIITSSSAASASWQRGHHSSADAAFVWMEFSSGLIL